MKKFLFVAILGAGSLIACNDTSNTVNGVDTTSAAYKDSVAKASGGTMTTPPSTMGNDTTGTGSSMMGSDSTGKGSGSNMMSDTSHK